MKKLVLIITCILIGQNSFCQNYKSLFPTDTTQWNIFRCVPDLGGTKVFYSNSDTTINNLKYHILNSDWLYSIDKNYTQAEQSIDYIREDTVEGKFWYMRDNVELLFMDLSLEKGDTFVIASTFDLTYSDTTFVDTTYIENGRKIVELVKFVDACFEYSKIKFIEGIGSTIGFSMAYGGEGYYSFSLGCKLDNNEKVFSPFENDIENCILSAGGNVANANLDNLISIFPNPSTSVISIDIKEIAFKSVSYQIFDITGSLIKNGYINANYRSIIFSNSGLYYIVFKFNDRIIRKKAIIINN